MTPRALLTLCLGVALATGAGAQVMRSGGVAPLDGQEGQGGLPNRLAGQVGIVEALGNSVPPDLTFLDERGRPVEIGSLFDGERPVALAFVYHSCPMLCSLVLDGVAEAVETSDLALGEDYQVLAVSVDPRDTPARADSAKARYARAGAFSDPSAVHFWTVGEAYEPNVQALADAVGFQYAYDVRTGEYAHAGALLLLSPEGKLTRYLYGINYAGHDFRLGLVEASEGTVGSAVDRFLLTCYQYDEDAQSYSLAVLTVIKIGGGLLMLVFGGLLAFFWLREARRQPDGWDDARPATA